ncbi:MAG: hypothetical protein JNK74_22735 [Candidatus Hydrogenedentes bacterium]|nr:hypothetical protein [Candidatus Hydrogenedentota bacterium]
MSRNRTFIGAVGFMAFTALMAAGCASGKAPRFRENSPMEIASARLVLEQIKEGLSRSYPTGAAQFDMGELDEGCAVLLVEINGKPIGAAFWTSHDIVHYVNEPARALNPALPAAPKHITEKRVRSVAH